MKPLTFLALVLLVGGRPLASQEHRSGHPVAQSAPATVQLLVWNRAGRPIDLDVRLGEESVYADRLRHGRVATSIEAGRVLQRVPGTYVVRVHDRTRGYEDSVTVQIGSTGQNVGVHLTESGMAFVLTRGDATGFTPPPSAPGSR